MATVAIWVALATGCGDGSTGPAGPQGPAGPAGATAAASTALKLVVNDATLGSASTVDFTVLDQNGVGFVGLPASTLEMTLAKLVPGTNGNSAAWQSYINTTAKPTPGLGIGTTATVEATVDSGGSLVDHADGTYTYTFGTNILAVAQPLAVSFDPSLTHRLAIAVRWSAGQANIPADNGIYTWQPSSGATTGILTHDIAETATCNQCHDHLALHGGPRQDVRNCVTCHNPGSTEPNSGNTLDFPVLMHKIHNGAKLPSVVAGTPYVIYGYGNSANDYSNVVFPQDVRNCTTCHDPANKNTPDAHLAYDQPTIPVCSSCHDNDNFALGTAGHHPGGVQTDSSQCSICHAANRVAQSVPQSHVIPAKVAAARFQFNIVRVTQTAPNLFPVIVLSVTNPLNANAPYNLSTDPAFTGSGSSLSVVIAWSNADYGNDQSGSYPGQPVSINVLTHATAIGDGTYTVTSTVAVPATVTGSGAVGMYGHPAADFTTPGTYADTVPVTSAVSYFGITDATPQPRRTVASLANCQKCHGQNDGLSVHGGSRTDNLQLCVLCHNPNATDLSQRPIDPDATPNGVNTAATDGLEQRTINFDFMVHAMHSAAVRTTPYTVYVHGGTPTNFSSLLYPGTIADCTQCHAGSTYEPPLAAGLLGTTVDTHATEIANGAGKIISPAVAVADSALFTRITPVAAACSSCHDSPTASAHMQQNGASFSILQAQIGASSATVETCAVCHGSGGVADVTTVHHLP